MLAFESTSNQVSDHFLFSNSITDLYQFKDDPNLNFGILTRNSISFQNSIDEVFEKIDQKTAFTYSESQDIYLIGAILEEEFELQSDCCLDFYSDIMNVAKMFLSLTKSKTIGIQLEAVTNDLCKFFHIDRVPYRLITTYKGPTTEWLPNSNVNRSELGKYSNKNVFKDKSKIQKLPDFSLGIFKGEQLLPGSSLVHRSPPLVNENEKRLIMRMDTISF